MSPGCCSIGIDVGGTKIGGGVLIDGTGELRGLKRIPTLPARGGEAVLSDAVKLAEALMAEAVGQGLSVSGIGVGIAELVDLEGNLVSEHSIHWRGLPVRAAFSRLAPVSIDADSRAAARAEARYGAGRSLRSFLYVTVGTGIGSAFVLDGVPWRGARGLTGTLASAPTTIECEVCGLLRSRILESYASGPALVSRYRERGSRSVAGAEDVLAHARDGDLVAQEIVRTAGIALGSALGLLVSVLDPEAVIVGGGLGGAGGLFWQELEASTRRHIWSELQGSLPIVPALHGANAGVVGAALLCDS